MNRSGFQVDLLSSFYFHFFYKDVRKFIFFKDSNDLPYEASNISHQYDLIVPSGDCELKIIKDSDLPAAAKLKLLPVIRPQFLRHLCSKVELAKIFKKQQVPSPAFELVENYDDLGYLAQKLGYPVLLKIDYSGGGAGTFKLNNAGDILNIPTTFRSETLLLQKFIAGKLFDLSGFIKTVN